ncbi:MAG: signal peptidase II [Oscillospiraceae bacterium]|nr:signal peptidase II [Oscillospiraceae bacterium]
MLLFGIIYTVILLLIGIDQWIKLWAIANLQGQPSRSFLPIGDFDWMHLTYTENTGAAFSMLSGSRVFLIVFPLLMILICVILMHRLYQKHRWMLIALPLTIAGGIGNLIDRIFRGGAVVDYLDLQLFDFAIFNFADCCVSVGVVMVIFCILFLEKEEAAPQKLPLAKPLPYARQCAELPDAQPLPEAELLPEAEPLSELTGTETEENDV